MRSTRRVLSDERRRAVQALLDKSALGVVTEGKVSPLTGQMLILIAWLALYLQLVPEDVQFNLGTPSTNQLIVSELSGTVTRLRNTFAQLKTLTPGLTGLQATIVCDVMFDFDDVTTIKTTLEPLYVGED